MSFLATRSKAGGLPLWRRLVRGFLTGRQMALRQPNKANGETGGGSWMPAVQPWSVFRRRLEWVAASARSSVNGPCIFLWFSFYFSWVAHIRHFASFGQWVIGSRRDAESGKSSVVWRAAGWWLCFCYKSACSFVSKTFVCRWSC